MKTTLRALSFFCLVAWALLGACNTTHPESFGGETNWLVRCSDDAACDIGSCICGVCTQSCSSSSPCQGELEGTCAPTESGAGEVLCADTVGSVPAAVCLPDCSADKPCGSNFRCMQGSCAPEPPMESTFPTPPITLQASQWEQNAPDQYVVQTCSLGIAPPGCIRAAVDGGEVVKEEERIFDPSAPGWEPLDLETGPFKSPIDDMFDDVKAGQVKGCGVDREVEYDEDLGYIQRYTTGCGGSLTGGRWVACFEANTLDLAACAVVPDDVLPEPKPDPEPIMDPAPNPAADARLAQLMQSEATWNEMVASSGDTYWYEEENCVVNSTEGSLTVVQVEDGVAHIIEQRTIARGECTSSVNRYASFVEQTMTELYAYCENQLQTDRPDVTLSFDDNNVLTGCVVDDEPGCADACGDGFFLRSWSFGVVMMPDGL